MEETNTFKFTREEQGLLRSGLLALAEFRPDEKSRINELYWSMVEVEAENRTKEVK